MNLWCVSCCTFPKASLAAARSGNSECDIVDGWEENKGYVYLIPQPLARDNSNLIADTLVNLEVERELWVVSLDDDFSGLLDGFCTNATHDYGCQRVFRGWLEKCENVRMWKSLADCGRDLPSPLRPIWLTGPTRDFTHVEGIHF